MERVPRYLCQLSALCLPERAGRALQLPCCDRHPLRSWESVDFEVTDAIACPVTEIVAAIPRKREERREQLPHVQAWFSHRRATSKHLQGLRQQGLFAALLLPHGQQR
ncbi:MAG: hypothetical protein ACRDL7_01310 [Gaiellaceae bacterium]